MPPTKGASETETALESAVLTFKDCEVLCEVSVDKLDEITTESDTAFESATEAFVVAVLIRAD